MTMHERCRRRESAVAFQLPEERRAGFRVLGFRV